MEAQQNDPKLKFDSLKNEDWRMVCDIIGMDKSTGMLNLLCTLPGLDVNSLLTAYDQRMPRLFYFPVLKGWNVQSQLFGATSKIS